MKHVIRDKSVEILLMLDVGDMMIRFKHIPNDSARTEFAGVHGFSAQLSSVSAWIHRTEATWSIETNERWNDFLHRAIKKHQSCINLDRWDDVGVLLTKVEIAWALVQHLSSVILHYHRVGGCLAIFAIQKPHRLFERTLLRWYLLVFMPTKPVQNISCSVRWFQNINMPPSSNSLRLTNKSRWCVGKVVRIQRPNTPDASLGKL